MEVDVLSAATEPPNQDPPPQWPQLVAAWLISFGSKNTRDAYRRDVTSWTHWCAGKDIDPLSARRVHIDAFVRELELEALRPATIARRLAALSSVYGYAEDERLIERNPASRVRRPKTPEISETAWLTIEQMRQFVHTAEQSSERDHLIALLLAVSALRSGEVRSLRIEEIGAYGGYTTILVHGKGDRDVRVPIPAETAIVLESVIGDNEAGFIIDGGPFAGWRWDDPSTQLPAPIDTTETEMSRWQLQRIVTRIANQAGINSANPKITPHSLRHSAITAALDAGVPIRDVEILARHADPRTTRRYDRTRHDFARHASLVLARTVLGNDTSN